MSFTHGVQFCAHTPYYFSFSHPNSCYGFFALLILHPYHNLNPPSYTLLNRPTTWYIFWSWILVQQTLHVLIVNLTPWVGLSLFESLSTVSTSWRMFESATTTTFSSLHLSGNAGPHTRKTILSNFSVKIHDRSAWPPELIIPNS